MVLNLIEEMKSQKERRTNFSTEKMYSKNTTTWRKQNSNNNCKELRLTFITQE